MSPRIELPDDSLGPLGVPRTAGLCPALEEPRRVLHRTCEELRGIDPVAAELVRLRNARTQRCHLCMTLRSRAALEAGATEDLFDLVDDFEHAGLATEHLVPLRVADAYLREPRAVTDEDRASWRLVLDDDQLLALVLRLTTWTANKVMVALGLDGDDLEPQTY